MKPRPELPDDPALPAIAAIRSAGLPAVVPEMDLGNEPVELRLCGYSPGSRATFEARVGGRRFAVKAYAEDPSSEAELYRALGDTSEVRVPPLLAWDRDLRLLIVGWLEGPSAHELIKNGQGRRAGELAARWLRFAASRSLELGPVIGAAQTLEKAEEWVATLAGADPWLGGLAATMAKRLADTMPNGEALRFVHGTLYDRHVLDTGDVPGLIDWQRFGRGPVELDAGTFLATVSRTGVRTTRLAEEVSRAEAALQAGTRGLLNEPTLNWYWAASLLRLASKPLGPAGDERLRAKGESDRRTTARERALALLRASAQHVEVAA